MSLPENLLRLRRERNVKQTEIVQQTGISLRAYQYYEHGEREPTSSTMIALADFYGISLDELVGRDWPGKV